MKKQIVIIIIFFLDGLTLELQATILKTGSCVNIRSKEEFQEKIWEIFAYYSRGETSYEAFLMEFRNKNHRHFQISV